MLSAIIVTSKREDTRMMTLPFTPDQFFEVFGSYNESLWPFAIALWLASFAALVFHLRGQLQRFTNVLLVTHWLWSAIAYHIAFFCVVMSVPSPRMRPSFG